MSTQGSIPIYSVRTKGTRIYVVRGGDVNDFKIYEYFIFRSVGTFSYGYDLHII